MISIVDVNNAEIIFDQNGVVGRLVFKQKDIEHIYLSFEPGSETTAHVQDILMTFFVAKGKAKVVIENKAFELKKGQLIEIPQGKSRQWKNIGKESLELFVVKVLK